jgi:acyl carrier protein
MDLRAEILRIMDELHISTTNIGDNTRLKEDLEMDSTELVEMAVLLEKRMRVVIDDAAFVKLRTFGEVERFMQSRMVHG